MGAHWRVLAKQAGYDPKKVVDVPPSFGKVELLIEMKDVKDAQFGNGLNCAASRCIKRRLDADWAWVGARTGILAPKGSRKLLRFVVNGIAIKQDKGMNVAGDKLILRAPPKSERGGARGKRRQDVEVRSHQRSRPGEGTTSRKHPQRSVAAMLRSDPT